MVICIVKKYLLKNKAMKNIITIVLLLGIMASSCEDDVTHNVAEGIILHSGTKKPLEGVKVYMYDGVGHSGGWIDLGSSKTNGSSRIDSTITDANGFFHIELDGEEPVLYPFKEGYSFEYAMGGAVIGIVPLNTGANKNLKLELDAWAYFKPSIIIGKECAINDTVWYGFGKYINVPSVGYYLGNGPHVVYYYQGDKGWPVKGDKFASYWFKYQINGIWNSKNDSVYVPSFTTYTDTLHY